MCSKSRQYFLLLNRVVGKHCFGEAAHIARYSAVPEPQTELAHHDHQEKPRNSDTKSLPDHRFVYPEFLPDPNPHFRNKLREKLERMDMLRRRSNIDIPEFYVGSILAITVADTNSPTKMNRFVGICIDRTGCGMRASCVLRNIVDGHGVEIKYEMYNPLLKSIEVLRLEKRLDSTLYYLRDAAHEYSMFSFDMEAEPRIEGAPVPVNPLLVELKPWPRSVRWENENLQGVKPFEVPEKRRIKAERNAKPWEKYDLMKVYRATIPEEEQVEIFSEVAPQLREQDASRKKSKRRSKFSQFAKK